MDIFIDDLIFSLQQAGGISVYWSELMKRMNKLDKVTCIQTAHSNNILANSINWQQTTMPDSNLPILFKRFLPLQKKLPPKSVFHSSYLRWSNQKDVLNILTIHDLAPEMGLIAGKGKYIRQWQQRKALEHADGVICVSETIRKDLLNHYAFLQPEKVKAIYHGVSDSFYPAENILEQKPFILFVGHRSGYKNFKLAVDVVTALPEMELVIVGGKQLSLEEQTLLNNKLNKRYSFKAVVEVDELNKLYNNAFCLLYPSSYEGFGLPIAEAMKVGCPVVTTNKAAIPEIAGNGALKVNSFVVDDFILAIQSLHEKSLRQQLISVGKNQAMNFSWDKCFGETVNFYQQIHRQKFNS
jgi:glycosyltransferase involved in cell wall biosynthesis